MKIIRCKFLLLIIVVSLITVTYLHFNICSRQTTSLTERKVLNWLKHVPYGKVLRYNYNTRAVASLWSTKKCQLEGIDPFHPGIVKSVVHKAPTLRCDQNFLPEITSVENRQLKVDIKLHGVTKIANFSHCRYRNITGVHEDDQKITFFPWSESFNTSISLGEDPEFFQVKCYGDSSEQIVISKSFFSLVPKRPHLDKLYDVKLSKRQVKYQPTETLNIVIVGVDGLSRHQFMRTMPKTYQYLTDVLGTFDFTMQGQHGDNTFSNFLPLLSGNLESDVKKWWDPSQPQDEFDFIFDDFEKAGYRTMYSEDNPLYSGFYWGDRFFVNPLTSYWNRPLHIAMVLENGFITRNGSCLGPRTISEFQLDYVLDFLGTFPDKPVFAISFFDAITHYETGSAGVIDDHLLDFYKSLASRGHLDKSLVILLSDHGPRWGNVRQSPNGRMESRNPLLFLTFPLWFLQKYPDVAQNLKSNTKRLTSYMDAHQMLLDILYFKSRVQAPLQRSKKGISLFEKIPYRSCDETFISQHQCFCKRWIEIPVDLSSQIALEVSNVLLQEVKSRSDKDKCVEFSLSHIISVNLLTEQNVNLQEQANQSGKKLYQVRLSTRPGLAIYEGKVHYDSIHRNHKVEEDIDRLNLFLGEVECLPTRRQVYCYCKNNPRKKGQ
ncbi:hypothetical protein RRG08_034420 [Elysia crispata]|uniref:Uncharacterized protein n=1 Tax=Elysia crispata TaxID=231223 RepID=A0AAE1CWR1_9GAST|nr:hypothetical protein RRG08_034420 [Elysia crispata]